MKSHVLTFRDVPLGYTAICLACGAKFRDAVEWLVVKCEPIRAEQEITE